MGINWKEIEDATLVEIDGADCVFSFPGSDEDSELHPFSGDVHRVPLDQVRGDLQRCEEPQTIGVTEDLYRHMTEGNTWIGKQDSPADPDDVDPDISNLL